MSTRDSTFEGNDISQTWSAFYFNRKYGLRGAHDGLAADDGVYFTGNTFKSNVLRNNYSPGLPLGIPFETSAPTTRYLGYDGQANSGETVPTASQFYLTNNTFVNNDFGLNGGPYFGTVTVPGAVVDQGNNTCSPPGWGVSLLACKSTPACSGVTASGLATSPSNGLCCSAPTTGLCNGTDGRACVDFQGANASCQVWKCNGQTCGWAAQ
jgi:hypothetical protein